MPFFHFLWTPESQRHIAEHGVTIEETAFEQAQADQQALNPQAPMRKTGTDEEWASM